MEKRKKLAREKVLQPVSDKELEININDIYPPDKGLAVFECFQRLSLNRSDKMNGVGHWLTLKFDYWYSLPGLGFPRRPSWNYEMTRENLLRKEEKSYRDYLDDLHSRNPPGSLSHFEHNLEVSYLMSTLIMAVWQCLKLYVTFLSLFGGHHHINSSCCQGVLWPENVRRKESYDMPI